MGAGSGAQAGELLVMDLRPVADGQRPANEWQLRGACTTQNKWPCVAEETPDDDRGFVQSIAPQSRQVFGLEALPEGAVVVGLTVHYRGRRFGAEGSVVVVVGEELVGGEPQALTADWADWSQAVALESRGQLLVGFECGAGCIFDKDQGVQVTQLWAETQYYVAQ